MFSVYKTVHPPTGIDISVHCYFFNSKEQNLLIASANRLQIYKFNPDQGKNNKLKLECVETFNLYGTITAMKSCRYGSMTKDALVLVFGDAKLSIVQYDSNIGDLVTLSIHYFENELDLEGLHYNIYQPILKVDPNMRCVVMLIYGFKLVVIPFYEEHSNVHQSLNGHSEKSDEIEMNTSGVTNELIHNVSSKTHQTTSSTSLSSYTIDLRKLDNWLEVRIIDIEFLYGYYEPTLFILCESNLTWVGRYALKKDTCNSVALSLNLNQKTHPIIWPVEKLPSDCQKCLAVPSPIGGILLFGVNSLIYVNQSVPSYGVSLNSIAKLTSNYPLKNMDHIKISLDSCQAAFIASDRLLISLKGGEIYIVSLLTDSESLRTIRSFNIEKGPGSVIASSVIKCNDNYVFIGSRLGNSVLLKYTVKEQKNIVEKRKFNDLEDEDEEIGENTNEELDSEINDTLYKMKNEQIDSQLSNQTPFVHTINECDDLDIILERNEEKSLNVTDVPSYNFEICDILLNVAPCGHSIVGESVGDYSEFETNSLHIDLVTSSGHTKNGAVSVLQRSIRPEVIATFQIPDVIDMWSVYNDSSNDTIGSSHTFLFLSKVDSTMVLQMANEITEFDRDTTVFCTKHPTMCCSNLSNNKYIIQVTSNCMYIYSECTAETSGTLVTTYDLSSILESKMKQVSVIDPYIVILTEKGSILLFKFDSLNVLVKLLDNRKVSKYEQNENYFNAVNCFSLYKDESKIFSNYDRLSDGLEKTNLKLEPIINKIEHFNTEITIDDEDELLYGSHTAVNEKASVDSSSDYISQLLSLPNKNKMENNQNKSVNEETDIMVTNSSFKKVTFWLLTVTLDGNLAFMNLKDEEIHLVYVVAKFYSAPKTLLLLSQLRADNLNNQESFQVPLIKSSSLMDNTQIPNVQEILMTSVGHEKCRPLLVARIEEDLIVYEAFIANEFEEQTSQINFKRINHEIIIRDRKKRKIQNRKLLNAESVNGEQDFLLRRTRHVPTLTKFESIAGFSGFCITGFHPYLVFFCPRSGLTPHPMWLDGQVGSFVSLKNASITMSGFIYFNKNFDIRICTLPVEDANGKLQIYYDSPWILKKIQTRQTIHFLCYHEESKTYAVVSSVLEPTNKLVQLGVEDKDHEVHEKDENFILPNKSQFYIQLYTPNGWEVLPLGKYTLAEWEHVSSLKLVSLPYEGHSSGFRSYLAASTINCYNEDVNSRGRVLIFDVIETVPEPDKPLTSIKMKTILEKEQKGPVTCLESINGYLLGGVGQKIYIWEYKNNELIGKAFIDTHFFVHRMVTLKNFVLIADLHKSISLIRFQPEYTKLSVVAKDKQIIDTYACDYLVDNTNLAFVSSDSEKNLCIYMYQSESHDNQGGQWLIRKAEFNVGSHINSMIRLKCKVNDPSLDKRSNLADKRQVTYCTNLDGGIGYLIPISEKTFRRLFILQNAIFVMKPHYAGLNPKAYRMWRSKRKELINPQKNILDGDLLFEFFNMSYHDRGDIAKKIKTNSEQILDDLTEIFQLTCHF